MLRVTRSSFAAGVVALVVLSPWTAKAQKDMPPTNDLPNPYQTISGYFKLPAGRTWGSTSAVEIDKDGKSIWVAERCGANSCFDAATGKMSPLDPILKFDENGNLVKSFGAGMLVFPHGIWVDRDGNVWVTDARVASPDELQKFPGEDKKGSVVVKFSPDGQVLMTLGKPGVRGNPPDALTDPNDIITDPATGDIYVAESHSNVEDQDLVGRISVFDKTGKFLRTIGKAGTGPGEFRTPHMIKFDSQGRLIVADRHNHRIQIMTKDGSYVGEYPAFGRVSGLAIDGNDTIYAADSESSPQRHPGWLKGIRIGSLKDGKVTIFVPPHQTSDPTGAMGEGIALDAAGNLYTAEATVRGVTKYVKD
jgi:DNA-binding beta-propeller fold protein YncE